MTEPPKSPAGPPLQTGAPAPDLDVVVLDALAKELDTDRTSGLLRSLARTFLQDAEQRGARIASAAAANDIPALEHESHTLGSSAATFGALALHRLARSIETACLQGDDARAVALSAQIGATVAAAMAALRQYLEDRPESG